MRFFGVLALAVACTAAPALAQETSDERARALYEEGTRLYEQGLYEEAVQAFKIAYSLSRRPLLLYNMAQAMERIGQWDEALAALVDYRSEAPPEESETLNSRISALEQRIAERDAESATPVSTASVDPETNARRGPPPVAWALFGTGAVGVGIGSVFTAQALGARSTWTGSCVEGPDGLLCPSGAAESHVKDNRSSLIADIGWVVGIAGVGGGVALSLGGGASDLTVAAGPGGVRLGGRW